MSVSDLVCVVAVVDEDLLAVWLESEEDELWFEACWLVSAALFELDSLPASSLEEITAAVSVLGAVSEKADADKSEFGLAHPAKEPAKDKVSMNAASWLPIC